MPVSLCTYNIHAGIGSDGRFDPQRILDVLRELDSDVLALQEVEHQAVDGTDLPEFLGRGCGCEVIVGPTLLRGNRDYGNALLTRLPVTAVQRIDLSYPGREPRGAIDVELDAHGHRLRVITTHLGLHPGERRAQARRLLAHLEAAAPAELTVLAGDFNEWLLWGRPLRWLNRQLTPLAARPTFPARFPVLALDRIWLHPRSRLAALRVHASPLARRASDHLPLHIRLHTGPP